MPVDALNSALAGLDVTKARIDLISQNIANAQTVGYTDKTVTQATDGLGVVQNRIDLVDHQPGYVRDVIQDEVAIRADQAGYIYVFVVNAQVVALPDEMLDHIDHRTFAQIVCSGFEAETQHSDLSMTAFRNELDAFCHLQFVARQDRGHDREFEIVRLGLVRQRPEILRQT